jgi:hypothetical protein
MTIVLLKGKIGKEKDGNYSTLLGVLILILEMRKRRIHREIIPFQGKRMIHMGMKMAVVVVEVL